MPDIVTNELYAEIDRLRVRVKELEEENRYLRAGCQDDEHQCPILGTNNTLIERIAELEAENKRLREALDGITTVAKIICNEFPLGTASLYGWVIIGEEALKEASDE